MRDSMLCGLLVAVAFTCLSCNSRANERRIAQVTTGGDPVRGKAAIGRYGCGSCHQIPGITDAVGLAGPPLSGIASRIYIAGVVQNTPDNMVRWIQHPKAVDEKTLMPELSVTEEDAVDIAGYLYSLR